MVATAAGRRGVQEPSEGADVGIVRDLIFDLGVFEGQDSAFYLAKGFRVVGLEAHPDYAGRARETFAQEIAEGRYVLVERALWSEADKVLPLYLRGEQTSLFDNTGSMYALTGVAEVRTVTLRDLVAEFGVPYYLKCDVEDAHDVFIPQLTQESVLPAYVSQETGASDHVAALARRGYDAFQIVNQGYHSRTRCPLPAREGRYVDQRFGLRHSGLFGRELSPRHWMSEQEAKRILALRKRLADASCSPLVRYAYRKVGKLTGRYWLVTQGWTDLHARHPSAVED